MVISANTATCLAQAKVFGRNVRPIERAKRRVAEHSAQPANTNRNYPTGLANGLAGPAWRCPFLGAGPKWLAEAQSDAIDPTRTSTALNGNISWPIKSLVGPIG
jgi:hypothetical protein